MAQAAETQGTKYGQIEGQVKELRSLIFKLSDCKNLDSADDLKKFCENINEIGDHYNKYCNNVESLKIPRKLDRKMRQYLAQGFMKANSIGIFTKFFNKMTYEILKYEGHGKDCFTFDCIKNILFILMSSADADLDFAEKICEEDDLLKFFYQMLKGFADTIERINPNSPFHSAIRYYVVERIVAILYYTLIHESKDNIKKMRDQRFVYLMKDFVNSDSDVLNNSNNLKVFALFFTSYLVDDTDVCRKPAERKLVGHIVSLLGKSLEKKKVFSSEELAKAFQ